MARFKLFPRQRRPSLGELLGISQAERQVSRRLHLRIVRERGAGDYSPPMRFARFLRRLFLFSNL